MVSLKVSAIAPTADALKLLTPHIPLKDDDQLSTRSGSVALLCGMIQQEQPDLIVAELGAVSGHDLALIESALTSQPHTALVLLSDENSPEFLLRAMRAGVREVVPKPLKSGDLREAVLRQYERLRLKQSNANRSGQLLAFLPVKGGCGSTFLSTSMAHALSQRGKRVALLDLNLAFGDASIYLSEKPVRASLVEVCAQQHRLDASLLEASMSQVSENLWLLAAPDAESAVDVDADSVERILALARTRFDFIVADLGRSFDSVTLRTLDEADKISLIAQASLPFVHNGRRLVQVLRELGYGPDKLELVINRVQKMSNVSSADIRRALQFDRSREIPNSYFSVSGAIDHGQPLLAHAPKDPVARAISEWAEELAPSSKNASRVRSGGWMRSLSLIGL